MTAKTIQYQLFVNKGLKQGTDYTVSLGTMLMQAGQSNHNRHWDLPLCKRMHIQKANQVVTAGSYARPMKQTVFSERAGAKSQLSYRSTTQNRHCFQHRKSDDQNTGKAQITITATAS